MGGVTLDAANQCSHARGRLVGRPGIRDSPACGPRPARIAGRKPCSPSVTICACLRVGRARPRSCTRCDPARPARTGAGDAALRILDHVVFRGVVRVLCGTVRPSDLQLSASAQSQATRSPGLTGTAGQLRCLDDDMLHPQACPPVDIERSAHAGRSRVPASRRSPARSPARRPDCRGTGSRAAARTGAHRTARRLDQSSGADRRRRARTPSGGRVGSATDRSRARAGLRRLGGGCHRRRTAVRSQSRPAVRVVQFAAERVAGFRYRG